MVKQGKITVKNDIGTRLVVRVQQDEGPDDLDYEVYVTRPSGSTDGYIFYFNSEQEFRLWIAALDATFLK